jgi:Methyltransferase domain
MLRRVSPETLDELPEDDAAAVASRLDLQRIHKWMGSAAITQRALQKMTVSTPKNRPLRVLELGAGDGSLMLAVAESLWPTWPCVNLSLLDRVPLLTEATSRRFAALGWTASNHVADVLDWAREPNSDVRNRSTDASRFDVIVSHLFLHHFDGAELATLLRAAARRCDHFFACEPRRAPLAWAASHMVGALGANAVTRGDAVLSVHAGFRAEELSSAWDAVAANWHLQERKAGWFSHCFVAERHGTSARQYPRAAAGRVSS